MSYTDKLKEYIDQLSLNNETIDCIFVNPKDYNNYILSFGKIASINYDTPHFGTVDPIRVYGVAIRVSPNVPEGHFIKSPYIKTYIPLQVSRLVFKEDGSVAVETVTPLEDLEK